MSLKLPPSKPLAPFHSPPHSLTGLRRSASAAPGHFLLSRNTTSLSFLGSMLPWGPLIPLTTPPNSNVPLSRAPCGPPDLSLPKSSVHLSSSTPIPKGRPLAQIWLLTPAFRTAGISPSMSAWNSSMPCPTAPSTSVHVIPPNSALGTMPSSEVLQLAHRFRPKAFTHTALWAWESPFLPLFPYGAILLLPGL